LNFAISFGISKKILEIRAVAYSADLSKYLNNFAKKKKENPFASKFGAHTEQIHEKNRGQTI
jgi:hypothetical protein